MSRTFHLPRPVALGKVMSHQPLAIVNALVVDSECCQECTTKSDLESTCLAEAGRRFTQANDTPFLTSLLLEIFGETGVCSKAFNVVLERTFVLPSEYDKYMKKVLQHLSKPPDVPVITLQDIPGYTKDGTKLDRQLLLFLPFILAIK